MDDMFFNVEGKTVSVLVGYEGVLLVNRTTGHLKAKGILADIEIDYANWKLNDINQNLIPNGIKFCFEEQMYSVDYIEINPCDSSSENYPDIFVNIQVKRLPIIN